MYKCYTDRISSDILASYPVVFSVSSLYVFLPLDSLSSRVSMSGAQGDSSVELHGNLPFFLPCSAIVSCVWICERVERQFRVKAFTLDLCDSPLFVVCRMSSLVHNCFLLKIELHELKS